MSESCLVPEPPGGTRTRSPRVLAALSALLAAVLPAAGQGFPNVARPQAGALLSGLNAPSQGRTAIIAWHNGILYTVPESPSSNSDSDDRLVRSWDISTPENPQVLELLGTTRHPVNAHGYLHAGPLLVIGDNLLPDGQPWSFLATADYGVNQRTIWSGMPGGTDGGIGDRGRLYHPFHATTWWSYDEVAGNAVLSRVGGPQNENQPLASWDHLALTGVIGHPFIVGNLLIYASDQSRTGVATYDISDPAQPQLLDVLTQGGPGGYWPELWGGDGKLYVVWPYQNGVQGGRGFRVVDITDPTNLRWVIDRPLAGDEPMYAQFQDEFAFIANHKIDMRSLEPVLTFPSATVTRTSDGGTGVDTSQFALPLGNLLVTGGSGPNQGMAIWVHQTEPDTRGPEVGFHIPRAGQTNYPLNLPVTLLIHETLETRTLVNGETFLVRPVGGSFLPGTLVFAFDDTLTFTPDQPLLLGTTYEVILTPGGLEDAAGNATAGYSYTFSTGAAVSGNAPPDVSALEASAPLVAPGGGITFTATAADPEGATLEYRFDAGDGRPKTDWSASAQVSFTYTNAGHFQAVVQVRDPQGAVATRPLNVTVFAPAAGPQPTRSSSIALDGAGRAWVVNPDNDTVTVIHIASGTVEREVPVGDNPRSIAVDGDGNAWVACHGADRLELLAAADGAVLALLSTGYGSAPFGVALSPDGAAGYVSLYGSGRLLRFNPATRLATGTLDLGPTPRAVAVSGDGSRVLVSRFISPPNHGEVWEVLAGTFSPGRTLRLPKLGWAELDGTASGRGVPNYLAGLAVSPDDGSVWVASNKPNVERGTLFGQALDHDNTVRNLLTRVNLATGLVDRSLDLDNSDSATAVAFSPLGDYLFVTLQGNNEVVVFDALTLNESAGLGGLVTRLTTGPAPQGVVVDAASGRILTQNFMGRSVTSADANPLLLGGEINLASTTIPTVATEALPASVLTGKRIFYNAADPRMSAEGYLSCASCHVDGGSDGRVWDFTQRGEGLRNTVDLRGRAGMGHGNVHWSANFDEIQDFEHDIRSGFGGAGFLPAGESPHAPLGAPNAGRSSELDALAAYVASLGNDHLPRSPHRAADGTLTAAGTAGRNLFVSLNCAACHGGDGFTDSTAPAPLLHAVGTLRTTSGPQSGLDTPTLRGLWHNAPYLHDGSARSLEEVFSVAGGAVIQAESGVVAGGGVQSPANGNIAINWDNTVTGGLVELSAGGSVTFQGIHGGDGGAGAVEIRYSTSGPGFTATVRVNGVDHVLATPATGNNPAWRTTFWSTARVEGVALLAGPDNVVQLISPGGGLALDQLTVSTAQNLAAAAPHRTVLGLSAGEHDSLMAFLRQLDGSPVSFVVGGEPGVTLTLTPGQPVPLTTAFADFDIGFSRAVQGLEVEDFMVGGTAGAGPGAFSTLTEGTSYRLRLEGFAQAGTVTLQLPAGTVSAVDDGTPNLASAEVSVDFAPPPAGPLHRWSFNEAAGAAPAGTVLPDSVAGLALEVRGLGAAFDGARLTLPGTTDSSPPDSLISAYLNLPNGVISALPDLTVEIWATPIEVRNWGSLFEFGRMNLAGDGAGEPGEWTGTTGVGPAGSEGSDLLSLTTSWGLDLNTQRQVLMTGGAFQSDIQSSLPTTPGQAYHYVVTVAANGGGSDVAWYRDGVLVGTDTAPFLLSAVEDVNNWFGRSHWSSLSTANTAYDEIRLYDRALTPAEIIASRDAGPDASFGSPVAQADAATLHHGQKVRVNVLANDTGGFNEGSVALVDPPQFGAATVDAAGRILYHHTAGAPPGDSFTYRVSGAGGISDPATVTLTFATGLRIPHASFDVPAAPPPTSIAIVPALGALTFQQPICLATVPGDPQRLFVVERQGTIRVVPEVTAASPTAGLFLDLAGLLTSRGELLGDTYDQGLMSLAFHPQHAANGHFYVFYSVRVTGLDYFRVSRFTTLPANPNAADPASELVLLQQRDENGYHLGTDLHFGPDGYLYIALGDGGGQNDSRQVSQRIDLDFFSAMARIDVDKRPENLEPNEHPSVPRDGGLARYSVPADNPYVTAGPTVTFNGTDLPAETVRTEFFAVGLRNPWRFSFDPATGELWCGDVGQVTYEEVNLITSGGNYGWSFREGTVAGPQDWRAPAGFAGVDPLYQYPQGNGEFQGNSITGGVVYRGTRLSSLTGAYVFADHVSGHIWSLRRQEGGVQVERIAGEAGIVAFGTDPANGDVLLVDIFSGQILRLTEGSDDSAFPQTLGATGLFADLTDLAPAPGLLPYEPNQPFWSDHALKRRWFAIPDPDAGMAWARDAAWTFPAGMIWVKHFDLELERGNPATARRLETRLLVKTESGAYGVSYRWNESQTEATLVPDAGENLELEVIENGLARTQHYRIPSRAECLVCHTPQAGHALSFSTRQLNRVAGLNGFTGNQLTLLHAAGYFTNQIEPPHTLARHVRPEETAFPAGTRARSYLAVNCANCHQAGGTAPPSWDARAHLSLADTGLINGAAVQNGGDPLNRLIVPGDAAHSIVLNRTAAANGFTRMPPIGSNELDQPGVDLLTQWIEESLPATFDNQSPLGMADEVMRPAGRTLKIPVTELLANDTDADGPSALSLIEVSGLSVNGARVWLQGAFVIYDADAGDADDAFGYVLSDGAATSLAAVAILVTDGPGGLTHNIDSTTTIGDERHFAASGIPGRSYRLQRAFAVTGPWLDVAGDGASGTASDVGELSLRDASPTEEPVTFYRIVEAVTP